MLYSVQLEKKCLVVLDDVWGDELWHSIKAAFPASCRGKVMLITTRNKGVAKSLNDKAFINESHLLDDEAAWLLFKRRLGSDLSEGMYVLFFSCSSNNLSIAPIISSWFDRLLTINEYLIDAYFISSYFPGSYKNFHRN